LFIVVRYFVPDVGVKVKLSEFKSLQLKLLQYLAKIATYSKQDMNHICVKRVVVLKRPGFQSRKYGMPNHEIQPKQGLWHRSHTDWRRSSER